MLAHRNQQQSRDASSFSTKVCDFDASIPSVLQPTLRERIVALIGICEIEQRTLIHAPSYGHDAFGAEVVALPATWLRGMDSIRHSYSRPDPYFQNRKKWVFRSSAGPKTFSELIAHYRLKELPKDNHDRKRKKTKKIYEGNLKNHIEPRWGSYRIRDIASTEVEEWLDRLKLAPGTPAKLRNQMSTVFRHGIRWGVDRTGRKLDYGSSL